MVWRCGWFSSGLAALAIVACLVEPGAGIAAARPARMVFRDVRPRAERTTGPLGHSPSSCEFGVVRLGDASLPAMVDQLKDRLRGDLGRRLAGRTVSLEHYLVYYNDGAKPAADGEAPRPQCARARMWAGWFDPSELTNKNPPFVVEIQVNIDGRRFAVRRVYSPVLRQTYATLAKGVFGSLREGRDGMAALDAANAALVAQIARARLP